VRRRHLLLHLHVLLRLRLRHLLLLHLHLRWRLHLLLEGVRLVRRSESLRRLLQRVPARLLLLVVRRRLLLRDILLLRRHHHAVVRGLRCWHPPRRLLLLGWRQLSPGWWRVHLLRRRVLLQHTNTMHTQTERER
jgi:hypothetical protein